MSDNGKYQSHYTPSGFPEYKDGLVFTTIIPLATKEITGEVTEKVHAEAGDDFRVKF